MFEIDDTSLVNMVVKIASRRSRQGSQHPEGGSGSSLWARLTTAHIEIIFDSSDVSGAVRSFLGLFYCGVAGYAEGLFGFLHSRVLASNSHLGTHVILSRYLDTFPYTYWV